MPRAPKTPEIDPTSIEAQRRKLALADCAFYASEYLTGDPKPPYNGRFLISEHHERWSKLINTYDRLAILASRDGGKSFMFSKAYPLWMAEKNPWTKGPQTEGVLFGSSQPNVRKVMLRIMWEVENNPRLTHLDPYRMKQKRRQVRWSADCLEFANGFVLFGFGIDARSRGPHPIFAVLDDILDEEHATNKEVRQNMITYIQAVVEPMIPPGGQMIVVGTPLAKDDIYGYFKERKDEYHFEKFPAITDFGKKTEHALWPERYSLEWLHKKRRRIGPLLFTREYLCEAISDIASLFPLYLFENTLGAAPIELPYALGQHDWRYWQRVGIVRVVFGIDIAISNEAGHDYFVIFVLGLDKLGNRWVLDIIREAGLPFHRQLATIEQAHRRYRADLIYIESNQMQRVWRDELMRTTDLPVQRFDTTQEKHTLDRGLPSLRILLENSKYRFPKVDRKDDDSVVNIWIYEMQAHSLKEGKVVTSAPHDDTCYSLYIAEQALEASYFSFAIEASEEDTVAYDEMMAEMFGAPEEDAQDPEDRVEEAAGGFIDMMLKAIPSFRKSAKLDGVRASQTESPKIGAEDNGSDVIDLEPQQDGSWTPPRAPQTALVPGSTRVPRPSKSGTPPPQKFSLRDLVPHHGAGDVEGKRVPSVVEIVLGRRPGGPR